ncbi:hypothetical protein [Luteimonas sp. e5]
MTARIFSIPADHPALPGHFPGHPVVPGVMLLDAVLQAIEAEHGPQPPLCLPQVKFVQPLLPGEEAEISLESPVRGRWRFRVHRGETLLASGEMATP